MINRIDVICEVVRKLDMTMLRPSILPRVSLVARRGFFSSATVRKLPSVEQPHILEKPGKDDTNPQTENMKKARKEKETTSQDSEKKSPPGGLNAGVGMQVVLLLVSTNFRTSADQRAIRTSNKSKSMD
jgi:hypothetical protein